MSRFIALLRAINVGGGRTVNMQTLRRAFESLGFLGVETFIASGNLIFETSTNNAKGLERKIEKRLREVLGYEVATFIRTDAELAEIAKHQPFSQSEQDSGDQINIVFLADALDGKVKQRVKALNTDTDEFQVRGREIYWRRRKKEGGASFSTVPLEKTIGKEFTVRGAKTIKRIADDMFEPVSNHNSAP